MFEKTANYPHGTVFRTQDEAVSALITAFQAHEKIGRDLHTAVNEIEISCGGWTAYIAQKVIEYIQVIVKDGGFLRGVLNESYKKAQAAVDEEHNFVRDHPVWAAAIVAVIALGICCLLAPWMLEAVGFAELGPVEGSWAARWMASYGEAVPKGSLYSYIQRLGMTWGKKAIKA
ncbi:MAG: hypothetical protein MMC33_003316 [Icmadophila ericetorum]|nr:hypothetical protein [Icmadophila ericetorum]